MYAHGQYSDTKALTSQQRKSKKVTPSGPSEGRHHGVLSDSVDTHHRPLQPNEYVALRLEKALRFCAPRRITTVSPTFPHLVARSSRLTARVLSQRKQIRDASRPTTAPPSCRQSRSSSRRSRPRCSLWSASRRGSPSSPFAHRVLPRGPSSPAPRRSSHATRRPSRL